jgi:hypothetical protein
MVMSWIWLIPRMDGGTMGSVYTVAQLTDDLAAHPESWVGRVVRVRAVAIIVAQPVGNEPLALWPIVSRLNNPTGGGSSLLLVLGSEDRVLGALRRLPVLGGLVPPPQVRVWERPSLYRIRLEVVPDLGNESYAAVLLDARRDDN